MEEEEKKQEDNHTRCNDFLESHMKKKIDGKLAVVTCHFLFLFCRRMISNACRARSYALPRRRWVPLFCRRARYALPLCRWAARGGAAVHPALALLRKDTPTSTSTNNNSTEAAGFFAKGNCVAACAALPKGTPLMSVPLRLCLVTEETYGADAVEEATQVIARGLHDSASPWQKYFEFLHDTYNDDDVADWGDEAFASEIDELLGGNSMRIVGVRNAPFLDPSELRSGRGRVEAQRAKMLVRRLQQSLPHFAAGAAAWALSMALSRCIHSLLPTEEGVAAVGDASPSHTRRRQRREVHMFPLIDLCNHSFHPTARCEIVTDCSENGGPRLHLGCTPRAPFAHLFAARDIAKGQEVTCQYDAGGDHGGGGVEWRHDKWLLNWGFVP